MLLGDNIIAEIRKVKRQMAEFHTKKTINLHIVSMFLAFTSSDEIQ